MMSIVTIEKTSNKIWFKNLQKARELKHMTQVRLAIEAEISQQSITFYESGTRVPSLEVANKLAKILNVSIDYSLGEEDNIIQKYYELNQKNRDTVEIVIEGLSDKQNK